MLSRRFAGALLALALLPSPSPAVAGGWGPPEIAGLMNDARLDETSGMVPARVRENTFWVHNDSGNAPELHLMSASGEPLASVPVDGVRNTDWEDLAAFTLEGKRYLLIADTGDNGGLRRTLRLLVVEEPKALTPGLRLRPAWTLEFRWPDGARDCEAVAVDAAAGEVLLISKKRVPPELFRLDLKAPAGTAQEARLLGHLQGIEQPTKADLEASPVYGRYRSQVTAADLSPDGRRLAVLNYRAVYLYQRAPGEDWSRALEAPAQRLEFVWTPQAEAIAFGLDGRSLWVAGEQRPSPLIRFRATPP